MKKILILLFTFLFFVTSCVTIVFADNNVEFKVAIDSSNFMVISGKVSPSVSVTVKVLDPNGNIDYIDQTQANSDGSFNFRYSLAGKTGGTYTVYIYSKDLSQPVSKSITYTPGNTQGSPEVITIITTPSGAQQQTQQQTSQQSQQQIQQQQTQQQVQQQTQTIQDSVIKAAVEVNGRVAVSKVDEKTLTQVISNLKANEGEEKIIEILVETKANVSKYEQVIPVKTIKDKGIGVSVTTSIGQVKIPDKVVDIAKETLSVTIGKIEENEAEKLRQTINKRIEMGLNIEIKADNKVLQENEFPKHVIVASKLTPTIGVNPKYLTVMKIESSGKVKVIPSGMYFYDTKEIRFRAKDSGEYVVVENYKTFNDISGLLWAKEPIEILASKGVINGVNDKNFAPQRQITRADFLLMLVRAFELEAKVNSNFSDVKPGDYYYEAVGIAKSLGIVNGVGNNRFAPNDLISRQDIMVIVDRTLKVVGYNYNDLKKSVSSFKDANNIASYAKEAIERLLAEGFVQGSNEKLRPQDKASRAEAATIIYKVMNGYYVQQLK